MMIARMQTNIIFAPLILNIFPNICKFWCISHVHSSLRADLTRPTNPLRIQHISSAL